MCCPWVAVPGLVADPPHLAKGFLATASWSWNFRGANCQRPPQTDRGVPTTQSRPLCPPSSPSLTHYHGLIVCRSSSLFSPVPLARSLTAVGGGSVHQRSHCLLRAMCPDPRFVLQSDVDPQLLVCIPFREAVKIQTITITSRDGGSLSPTPSSFLLSRALDYWWSGSPCAPST